MSLKSYLRTIEAQRERESKYDPKPKYESFSFEKNKAVLIKHDKVPKRKKFVIPKSAVIAIVIAATLLAVLKNPSEKEAKAEVHTFIVEKLSEKMHRNLMDDEASSTAQFESEFLMLLGSIVIDKLVDTEVSDYIIFSKFATTVTLERETKTIASGIIIFGKVIPLKTDIGKEFVE